MSTLYRSPNVIIDAHEWHAHVRLNDGRITLTYRWRPLSQKPFRWLPMSAWVGPKPKAFSRRMAGFRRHIAAARDSENARRAALQTVRRVPTAAIMQNVGMALEQAA